MAESTVIGISSSSGRDACKVGESASLGSAPRPAQPPKTPLNKIYALPVPIKTFPLPTFYPNNPISLFHLVYAWVGQVLRRPPPEPSVVHTGVWDPDTRSVHVPDAASIRALWEQGFFGKGSLSRSEPNWLKRELARRGSLDGRTVSEARTELRREERRLAKWERAKAELEAIERQRLAEAASRAAAALPNKSISHTNGNADGPVDQRKFPKSVQTPVIEPSLADVVAAAADTTPSDTQNVANLDQVEAVKPPVGPAELLALPNSSRNPAVTPDTRPIAQKPPVGPMELLLLPNSIADVALKTTKENNAHMMMEGAATQHAPQAQRSTQRNGQINKKPTEPRVCDDVNTNGYVEKASALEPVDVESANAATLANGAAVEAVPPSSAVRSCKSPTHASVHGADGNASPPSKHRKSVRFSPTVESTTFLHSDPPSPNRSAGVAPKTNAPKTNLPAPLNGAAVHGPNPTTTPPSESQPDRNLAAPVDPTTIENKEHFQLAPEEAFFLAFSLGALSVVDRETRAPISTEQLLHLFRSYSYFPPRTGTSPSLGPDDPFLVHYAVYHHFRSLGWVPRHGIKFGVDWILYQRGPVFDHSEFGLMVMPAFSDPRWQAHEHEEPRRSWSWLMGVNRVLSHVLKSLVLVYVDIPPPEVFEECMRRGGIAEALKRYNIREVMVRRFSVNRNR
ncbi:hypothetical protein VTK26DRAFT_9426 [Humicola hyalothermophila]